MMDQAAELRKLVLQSVRQRSVAAGPPPRLAVAVSGKAGVGVTTLAVNVSVALAEQGARVVLVDADPERSGVARACGLAVPGGATDLITARRDIHEVLQLGPAGVQIVPGLWPQRGPADCSDAAQERMLRQFKTLGRHADLVMLDVGGGTNEFIRRCLRAADDVLLVTTPATDAVVECYARVKRCLVGPVSACLRLVVNQSDAATAREVYQRFARSCERFLGVRLDAMHPVPYDEQLESAEGSEVSRCLPFVLSAPSGAAAQALERVAAELLAQHAARSSGAREAA